jgi:carboxymethylenebutenolidase
MRPIPIALLVLTLSPLAALAQTAPPAAPPAAAPPAAAPTAGDTISITRDPNLPAWEEVAKQALETSPRHGEFVDIAWAKDKPPLRTWIMYPERKDKAGVVLVIHEIFGLSDWIRGVGDQLARDGFIAVVPDLISGLGPGGGGTDSVPSRDDVVKLVRTLTLDETVARLDAVRAYATQLPAANGKIATVGFCWGGGRSFSYATVTPPPNAAVVYYGVSPDSIAILNVKAPVLGLYGGDDARVDATIAPAQAALQKLKRPYEPHLFEGAGHGFLRAQRLRGGANYKATQQAWPRTIEFLRTYLK